MLRLTFVPVLMHALCIYHHFYFSFFSIFSHYLLDLFFNIYSAYHIQFAFFSFFSNILGLYKSNLVQIQGNLWSNLTWHIAICHDRAKIAIVIIVKTSRIHDTSRSLWAKKHKKANVGHRQTDGPMDRLTNRLTDTVTYSHILVTKKAFFSVFLCCLCHILVRFHSDKLFSFVSDCGI